MKRKLIWLILALAFMVRIIGVAATPVGPNADETSFGYDAYSIAVSGTDQWGNLLPLTLKSFGDHKSPLMSYLLIPFVSLFGLNVYSIRIAGVLVGTISVFVTYLLARKITKNEQVGLVAAFFLAINPWSVMLGRGAFESGLVILFIPLFIYLFLEKKYILFSIAAGAGLFTYHSAKLIIPLIILCLFYGNYKEIIGKISSKVIISIVLLIIFFVGYFYTFSVGGGSRIAERSITQGALVQGFDERMKAISSGTNPILAKLLHNKYQVIVKRFVNNYLQYYSPKFLVTKGVAEGSYGMIPGIAVLNFFEIVSILGIVPLLVIRKSYLSITKNLFLWLIITPLPAALSTGIGYAGNRASGMLPVLQLLSAMGLFGWYLFIKRSQKRALNLAYIFFGLLVLLNTYTFLSSYFKTPDNKIARQMNYGYLDMAKFVLPLTRDRNIAISRELSEPQIFLMFASKMDPNFVHSYTKTWDLKGNNVSWVDQLPSYTLGKVMIKSIDWEKEAISGDIVVIHASEKNPGYVPIATFYYPDGSPNIYVIDTNRKIYAKVL